MFDNILKLSSALFLISFLRQVLFSQVECQVKRENRTRKIITSDKEVLFPSPFVRPFCLYVC